MAARPTSVACIGCAGCRTRRTGRRDVIPPEIVDYTRSLPRLWADSGPNGRQALVIATFARLDVLGFQRLEYELTPDAMDLGLDAGIPPILELTSQIGEFGRGERAGPSLTQRSVRLLMINRTPPERLLAAAARSA